LWEGDLNEGWMLLILTSERLELLQGENCLGENILSTNMKIAIFESFSAHFNQFWPTSIFHLSAFYKMLLKQLFYVQ